MIELPRYARDHAEGLASAEIVLSRITVGTEPDVAGLSVKFKRFDVRNGRELDPEESFVTFDELEKHLVELEISLGAVKELLALKPQ